MFTSEAQLTCSASDKASHRYRSQGLKSRLNQKFWGFQFASACEAYNCSDLFKVRYVSPQFKYLAFVYSLRFILLFSSTISYVLVFLRPPLFHQIFLLYHGPLLSKLHQMHHFQEYPEKWLSWMVFPSKKRLAKSTHFLSCRVQKYK